MRGRRQRLLILLVCVATAAAAVAVVSVATGSSDQPQIDASVFPLAADGTEGSTYVDCSKVGAVTYDPHNPCQTFILVSDSHSDSANTLMLAEQHALEKAGWRASAPQPTDYDEDAATAAAGQSWISQKQRACAYVAPVQLGAAAEAKGLFPYDRYNQPNGVLDFYRQATRAPLNQTLWVRLIPSFTVRC